MNNSDRLVVLLRAVQWEADSVAYYLPQGKATRQQLDELAHAMQQTAQALREVAIEGRDIEETPRPLRE